MGQHQRVEDPTEWRYFFHRIFWEAAQKFQLHVLTKESTQNPSFIFIYERKQEMVRKTHSVVLPFPKFWIPAATPLGGGVWPLGYCSLHHLESHLLKRHWGRQAWQKCHPWNNNPPRRWGFHDCRRSAALWCTRSLPSISLYLSLSWLLRSRNEPSGSGGSGESGGHSYWEPGPILAVGLWEVYSRGSKGKMDNKIK